MVPPAGKRKRGDRTYSYDSNEPSTRPSPHRPQNLSLGQQNPHANSPRGSGRRGSRGGARGSATSPTSPASGRLSNANSTTSSPQYAKSHPTPNNQAATKPNPASPSASKPRNPVEPQPPPPPVSRIYQYEFVHEEAITSWKAGGRDSVINAGLDAQKSADPIRLSSIFEELIRAGLDRRIDPVDAGATVKAILSSSSGPDRDAWGSIFLDTLSIMNEMEPSDPTIGRLLFATEIPASKMREELDTNLLTSLDLVRSTFSRMSIRKTTNLLYRQSNYNLLREESEGYSKLLTEYFTTTNSEPPSGEVVTDTFERVKALIGAFDLDVGRVLDVTLDVFANLLVKHYRFFIKFLRISSWWPEDKEHFDGIEWVDQGFDSIPRWALPGSSSWLTSEDDKIELAELRQSRDIEFWTRVKEKGILAWFELGKRRVIKNELNGNLTNGADLTKEINRHKSWIAETNTLPPRGNYIAAQLLGFKLRFYASDTRDPSDVLPDNLIYLAALLIKIGFISLNDLYPHLYPPDEKMPELQDRLMKERAERERKSRPGGEKMNALQMAGALADDTLPLGIRPRETDSKKGEAAGEKTTAGEAGEEEQPSLPEPADQKTQLLKSLLAIGAVSEALFILGRFPWLPDVYPDLVDYIHRILRQSLSKVYEQVRPLADRSSVRADRPQISEQPGHPKGLLKEVESIPRKTLRWAQLDKNDAGDGTDYRYYWDDWADNVPMCQTVDDVFLLCSTLMNISGVKIGQDVTLHESLIRIGTKSLIDDPSQSNRARWLDLSKRLLVPALSMTKHNAGVVGEVWTLIRTFNTTERYSIYSEWFSGSISRSIDLKAAFELARTETKDVLKRISKTNTREMARKLAKVALGSPGIVFNVVLNQIESYNNLTEVVVECARYFSELGYDVLIWSLLTALGGSRNRIQDDGILTSGWLKALSVFSGRVFKRYSSLNVTPLLQYVAYQLRSGNSTDLEVLEELITAMAGVRSDTSYNESQTIAMTGGVVLRSLTLDQVQDKRYSNEIKSSSKRLVNSLVSQRLADQILIAIAQERQMYPYREASANAHLKVLGSNIDKIHDVLIQYLDMLRTSLPVEEFDAVIPDVTSLIRDFGLDPAIAFTIVRPSISKAITEAGSTVIQQNPAEQTTVSLETPPNNGDVDMSDVPSKGGESGINSDNPTESQDQGTSNDKMPNGDVEMNGAKEGTETAITTTIVSPPDDVWNPILKSLMTDIKTTLPENFDDNLSVSLYTTFWQLELKDLLFPMKSYEAERKRLTSLKDRFGPGPSNSKKQQQVKDAHTQVQKLSDELSSGFKAYESTLNRLRKEKNHWLASIPSDRWKHIPRTILQECFFPRMLLSRSDAIYVYHFMMWLHTNNTPGFMLMYLLDALFHEKLLANMITLCSPHESENLAFFLNEVLKELGRWHGKSATFERYALGNKKDLIGFSKNMPPKDPLQLLGFEDYRRLLFKWHRNLNNALKSCLSGKEYMQIRNAIIILKGVHTVFPKVNFMGKIQVDCITELSKEDPRKDLKLAAMSLLGNLKPMAKNWLLPQAFHLNDSTAHPNKSTSRSGSARPATPQPSQKEKGLDASVPEFKPQVSTINGQVEPLSAKSVEDGEIDDAIAFSSKTKETASTETQEPDGNGNDSTQKSEDNTTVTASNPGIGKQPDDSSSAPLPSTAAHSQATSVPEKPRPDYESKGRTGTNTPTQPRPQHALPNKPETQFPRGRGSNRPSDYHSSQHAPRHQETPEYGRLERPSDLSREGLHDRREQSPSRRSRGRTPERMPPTEWDRRDPAYNAPRDSWEYPDDGRGRLPPRDMRPPPREYGNRDRPGFDPSGRAPVADTRGRMLNNPPMNNPPANTPYDRTMGPRSDRNPYPQHPTDRSGYPPVYDRPPSGHERGGYGSDRTSMDVEYGRRSDALRSENDGRWERSSRPHSPGRSDERAPPMYSRSDGGRDDRRDDRNHPSERPPPPASSGPGRDRRDDSMGHAPTGPRGGRGDLESQPPGRGRELFQQAGPPRLSTDMNHGRLGDAPPSRTQQDPNYGRLNTPTEPPSGPRGRAASGRGRNTTGPPPHAALPPPPATNAHDRGSHRDRRNTGTGDLPDQNTASAPPTPIQDADTAGIHPSRLAAIQKQDEQSRSPSSHSQANSTFPPSGPRGSRRNQDTSNTAPSPRDAPTGPAGSERRDDRRRFPGLTNLIQQNSTSNEPNDRGDRAPSGRGRSNRGGPSRESTSGPPSHPGNGPPSQGPDRSVNYAADAPQRGQASDNTPDLMDRRSSRREGTERRSGRHRRSSRSRSPDREKRSDERDYRERESKRGPPSDVDAPRRESRRGRDDGRERGDRERDHNRERREVRETRTRDEMSGGGPRRGGPPTGDMDPPTWGGSHGTNSRLPSSDSRNGDGAAAASSGRSRRDDRERRDGRERSDRDGRKRGRQGEEGGDGSGHKRQRRGN